MRKFTNLAVLLLFTFQFAFFTSYAQSPKKFKYQTVVRNNTGTIVANQAVAFKISILQGSTTGSVSYSETQSKTTNDFGLVNLEIGSGIIVSGSMNNINWANGPYFVKVELDINNGTAFITMGTSELLSVPYALYAEKVGSNGFTETDPVFGTSAAHAITNSNINNWNTAFGWGNHAGLYRPIGYVPTWSEIISKPNTISGYGITDAFNGTWASLTGKPTLWDSSWVTIKNKPTTLAGYGITDAMSTSHVANAITTTNITNWTTAFGWGNHAGLYRPVSYVPAWSEITSKPNFATVATTGSYNDLTNKPAPYAAGAGIQFTGSTISANLNLSVSSAGDTLWLNPGNFVIVPSISSVNATSPIVSNTTITNITQTTANMGYTIALYGAPSITTRGVCWDTLINPTIAGYKTTETGGTGTFTSSMTGLLPNKIYYARAYAINANGTYYSSVKTFSTLPSTAILTTADTSNITTNSAVCGGNITDNGGASVTERGVCWATSQNPTISNNRTSNGNGNGSFTSNLTTLTPNTTYYYRAYATNIAGTSYGLQKSFTTSYVLPTIIIDTVENINQNSAAIWSYVISQGTTTITERGVCWNTNPNPTIYNYKIIDNNTGLGGYLITLKKLTPNATYYVCSYVISNYGITYSNQTKVFTTSNAYFESFENGYPTIWSGIGWGVSNESSYHATNSFLANQVDDSVQFTKTITTSPNGNISFYYMGTCNAWGCTSSSFYIDNVLQATFNEGSWTQHSYSITSGTHTFKWKNNGGGASNTAYIDYIIVSP